MPLRKAQIATASIGDNVGSFVNETAKRLHIRKSIGIIFGRAADVIGETTTSSLDEVPVTQITTDDSRSHIDAAVYAVIGGTAAVIGPPARAVLTFNRNDLVLDPDEALFVNNTGVVGTAAPNATWNLWYQD